MRNRQEIRSAETKSSIVTAAGQLFAEQGYESVTMREIAKAAGCSHTTIYIYFKDKEALLHQLSMGPMRSLEANMESMLLDIALTPEERLKSVTNHFIEFCFQNRNMFTIFFMTEATRVDEIDPVLEINKLRNHLFAIMQQAIRTYLPGDLSDELALAYARIYFFMLHGMVATYVHSEEPVQSLMERLSPTFRLAIDALLIGFKQTCQEGVDLT